jgi:hypothetical protein
VDSEPQKADWDAWAEEYGYVASEVYETIKKNSHLLDVADGNHAKWHENSLALLVVLPFEHAMAFSAESLVNDFENSPLHSHVFSVITSLILASAEVMDDSDYNTED